jgi:SNF2 family DNA or RNA helicase
MAVTVAAKAPVEIKYNATSAGGEPLLRVAGRTLFPFQVQGVQWMLQQEVAPTPLWGQEVPGGLLCDDMGLGKTIQTVTVMKQRPVLRSLVVVPVSVLRQWEEILCEAGCHVYELQSGDKVRLVELRADDTGDALESVEDEEEEDASSLPAGAGAGAGASADASSLPAGEEEAEYTPCTMNLRYAAPAVNIESMPPTFVHDDGTYGAPCIVVATYGRVRPMQRVPLATEVESLMRPLANIAWDRIVLDEGHVVRKPTTATSIRMSRLVRAPGCAAWILTGTPIHNATADLFALFKFMGFNLMRVSTSDVAQAVLAWDAKALRRTMADVPIEVRRSMAYPEEDFTVVEHHVSYRSESEADFYRAATGTIMEQLDTLNDYANRREAAQDRMVLTLFLRLLAVHPQIYISACNKQRLSSGIDAWPAWTGRVSKNEEVMELVQAWRAERASFVLFTHFKEELDQFREVLTALGYHVLVVDGSQTGAKRFEVLKESRRAAADGVMQALLVQIKSGGVGLNIQHLDRIIIPSPDWVPAVEAQAIARCHRMGQRGKVQVHRFFLSEVQNAGLHIEQEILHKQEAKSAVISRIVRSTHKHA